MRPINDNPEPVINLPPVVKVLCLINVAVFILGSAWPQLMTDDYIYNLAFVPARYFGAEPFGIAALLSPFTHLFIHANWIHLSVNVASLMAFGAGLERHMGGRRLLLLFFLSGLAGAFFHAVFYPHAPEAMIGASGAVSGLFGAILMMMYTNGHMMENAPLHKSAMRRLFPVVLVWIGISVFFGFVGLPGVENPIAWTSHIGGFLAGLLLYRPLRRLKIQR